jgi:hypothetical protein
MYAIWFFPSVPVDGARRLGLVMGRGYGAQGAGYANATVAAADVQLWVAGRAVKGAHLAITYT